jgi:delta24(24(1))-sterol reductase
MTCRKSGVPEGFVETPTRRRNTRKSVAAAAADSSAEDDSEIDPVQKILRDQGKAEDNEIKVAANGASNGVPNGKPNSAAANGAPKEPKIIDGGFGSQD